LADDDYLKPIVAESGGALSVIDQVRLGGGVGLQVLQEREVAKQQRKVALATIRPQVQAFANLDATEQLEDDLSGTFGYSLGAQVTWNFFDGGSARAQAAQEDENIAIAETQFSDTKNVLRFEVEQAYSSLQSNFKNISTASNTVNQAEEGLRLARLRFQAGIGTQLEITTAESDLTQAGGNLVGAILDYNRALAAIQRATSYQQALEPFSGNEL
ncbi:MAG: TolC family protein, partial [Cyanobacteria bacterium P01_A01_bin.17]